MFSRQLIESYLYGMNLLFPASYSTLCPQALASLVSEKYGLGTVQCQLLVRGVADTYLVEASAGRFILRAYRSEHRNQRQVKAEIELLNKLKEVGVPVSYPMQDLYGEYIRTVEAVEGKRQLVLFSYAPGHPVSILNERQLYNLGREMARFHDVSSTIELQRDRWNYDLDTILFKPLEMLKFAFRDDPEGYLWMQQAARKVETRLTRIGTSGFSTGYCHFDFLPKNFHFDGDSITFFDFDFLGYGWLVNDIMTFWQHLCLEVHFGRMKQVEANNAYAIFLNAYRKVRHLSEKELEAVPHLSLGFWLFYMGFHTTHDQFFPFVQPAHLKLRTGLIRQMMERYWTE